MSVLVVLVAAGFVLAGGFIVGFVWAVRSGQFDDTTTPAVRILMDSDDFPLLARREIPVKRHEETP
jgi:cbb3-type cytochrome oxidase maturation protein